MTAFPVVVVESASVDNLLRRVMLATGNASMMGWLAGPVTQSLQARARERFLMEGDDASGPWEPLAEATQSFRSSGGFGPAHPINRRTGEMERHIVGANSLVAGTADGAFMTWPGSQPTGLLGKKVTTAQAGWPAEGGRRKTPPRPVIAADVTDLEMMMVSLATWIIGGIQSGVG